MTRSSDLAGQCKRFMLLPLRTLLVLLILLPHGRLVESMQETPAAISRGAKPIPDTLGELPMPLCHGLGGPDDEDGRMSDTLELRGARRINGALVV